MNEIILIKSEHYDIKKIKWIIYGVPCIFLLLGFILYLCNFDHCKSSDYLGVSWSILDNMCDPFSFFPGLLIDLGLIIAVVSIIVGMWLKSYSMTVTDKRIYGTTSWGKHVDLPIDSITAIATHAFKGIAVATSSGKIAFNFIKNRDSIHQTINNLIIERQDCKNAQTMSTINTEKADEIKKYKALLDDGIITQEEFEAKKKQLLGL